MSEGNQEPGGVAAPRGAADAAWFPLPVSFTHALPAARDTLQSQNTAQELIHSCQSKELDFDYYFEIITE